MVMRWCMCAKKKKLCCSALNVARRYVNVCRGQVGSDRDSGHDLHSIVVRVYDVRGVLGIVMANVLRCWAWASPTRIM